MEAWRAIERIALLMALLGAVFAAGANWHRLDGVEAALQGLARQEDAIKVEYERKDVLEAHLRNLNEKLDDLKTQVSALRQR